MRFTTSNEEKRKDLSMLKIINLDRIFLFKLCMHVA